jgi:hypothetical protein
MVTRLMWRAWVRRGFVQVWGVGTAAMMNGENGRSEGSVDASDRSEQLEREQRRYAPCERTCSCRQQRAIAALRPRPWDVCRDLWAVTSLGDARPRLQTCTVYLLALHVWHTLSLLAVSVWASVDVLCTMLHGRWINRDVWVLR